MVNVRGNCLSNLPPHTIARGATIWEVNLGLHRFRQSGIDRQWFSRPPSRAERCVTVGGSLIMLVPHSKEAVRRAAGRTISSHWWALLSSVFAWL
jgi:hypothetical protein